jgi:multidrug efflux pump subunit AcrB
MPVTANVAMQLAEEALDIPEVTAVQTYAGTAQPFNFNGMVRHYYLRNRSWEGDLLVMLLDKNERERSSHQIAVDARARFKPIAERLGAKIAVVEMPPGPPVLQTNVAEVHGPDARTRREVAAKMTEFFEEVPIVVDVDNYMADPYDYWRFEVDTQKAVRRGVSVDTINNTLAMAMGGYKLGDIKRGTVLEPTYIIIQVPLSVRSQITRLGDLPVTTSQGGTIPLSELGQFMKQKEDPIIYTKDLRGIEYVVGEMEGRLGAPIYGMLAVEDYVKEYTTPDGNSMTTMPMNLFGPPKDDFQSNYEWTGEWTVTYETFRDMGIAFMAALVLIYGLIVWEFKNFALAGLIMSPIPLTMIGIIPGHWLFGAEFTATSMIGMIALGGIIVRQSILIVEFVKLEVAKGNEVKEAAIKGAELRMRPIFITSLTLMAGAFAILQDPIFNGMAISLLFGAGVATVMALLVIPLGCISARKQFYVQTSDDGTVSVSPMYERIEQVEAEESAPAAYKTPLWMRLYGGVISAFTWVYYIARAVFTMLGMGFKAILGKFGGGKSTPPPPREPPPASTPPPPAGGTPPPAPPAEPTPTPVTDSGAQPEPAAAAAEPEPVASAAEPAPAPAPQASAAEPAPATAPQTSASLDVDEPGDDSAEHEEEEGVSQKRRGIRLKQDLG